MPLSNAIASAFVSFEAVGPFRYACPGCYSSETLDVISLPDVPVNCSALWTEQQQALCCTTGAIYLRSCQSCGLVYNACFDSALLEYDTAYENSLDFSPAFQAYTRELAQELIHTHGLRNRHIIEIGCGAGKFLKAICQLGQNTGCGYDPSFPGDEQPIGGVEFIRAYFNPETSPEHVDFLCCRHVLEHIEKPLEFLIELSRTVASTSGTVMYFEVPNGDFVLGGEGLWDVIYPHVSYFTEPSLTKLFEAAGMEVLRTGRRFANQFLFVEARARGGAEVSLESSHRPSVSLSGHIASTFASRFAATVAQWSECLVGLHEQAPVAFWGAGAKGITFLNVVPHADRISCVVDSNPRKQGMFVPGTGQQIVSPAKLKSVQPGFVILLNPVYRTEVASLMKAEGITASLFIDPCKSPRATGPSVTTRPH